MVVHNVDYAQLQGNPRLLRSFTSAIEHAVASKAGRYFQPECVDVKLSPGSVGVLAVVSPPKGCAFALATRLSSAVLPLGTLLTRHLSDVVNNSGIDTGGLSISDVAVHAPPLVGTPAYVPGWWELTVALIFLISLTVVLAQASLLKKMKQGGLSSRNLLPSDDPERIASAGLDVHFLDAGNTAHQLTFNCKPWGLIFFKDDPTRVQDFRVGSYAREKGVKRGWRITRIGNKIVPQTMQRADLDRVIDEGSLGFDVWPLRLDFKEEKGEVRTIYLKEGPLGMAFYNRLPIVISAFRPSSVAQEMGVEIGWMLVRVGDVDLHSFSNFDEAVKQITDGAWQLPTRPGSEAINNSARLGHAGREVQQ